MICISFEFSKTISKTNKFVLYYVLFLFSIRALGKTGLIESDTTPSIITVTSADESEVDISEAVEKVTGTN